MGVTRKVILGAGAAAGIYGSLVRPRLQRWGATEEEVAGPYPGADLVPEGKRSATSAVTIEASPEQVWPWLVQMGWGRGGWYSWDRLDNGGRPSATKVHQEWQDLSVGDQLSFWMLGRRMDAYRIGALEPNRYLGLYGYSTLSGRWREPDEPRPSAYMEGIWGFLLNELPGGRTRLVVSGYQTFRPRWIERLAADWLLLPVSWFMQARMLVVLKRTIERATDEDAPKTAAPGNGEQGMDRAEPGRNRLGWSVMGKAKGGEMSKTRTVEELSAPLDTVDVGHLVFSHGASNLTIRVDDSSEYLYRARFEGAAPHVRVERGTVTLRYRPSLHPPRGELSLSGRVPWTISAHAGMSNVEADLEDLELRGWEISAGASRVGARLPRPKKAVPIKIGAGASHVEFVRPPGVPVRVHVGAGASKLAVDDFSGSGRIDWQSPDYEEREGRYDIEIGAGASKVTVRT